MATWSLSFDYVACFLLLLILVWYFSEKRIPLRSHRVFLALVTLSFVATGLEIAYTQFARLEYLFGTTVFDITFAIQLLTITSIPVFFMIYIFELAHIDLQSKKYAVCLIHLFILLDIVYMIVNSFTHFAFEFVHGRTLLYLGSIPILIMDGILCVICGVVSVKYSKEFMFVRSYSLLFTLVSAIFACVLQIKIHIPLINLMLASLAITLYYYLQNPGTVTDVVTKQFNRKFMGEYVRNSFRSKKPFGVIVVAMDDFKFINKTYGVENGDNLLFQLGSFLDSIKASKTVFRFGSDQFCVVINKNIEEMLQVAEQIENRFKHPWFSDNQTGIMMSASICCINCPEDADNYGSLVEVMDYSMSLAKKTSKGKVTIAKDLELEKITKDKAVEKAVKQAMDKDELLVYFQPIFSIKKGVYNSAEALVRLHDEELGWISPEVFIPIAEKNGLIVEMGETILRKVCQFIRDFNLKNTTVEYIEINISPVQLMQIGFADRVKTIMDEYGVTPDQLNIEITETATISTASTVNDNIAELVEYGLTFSLDDYGSGYANIDYINHMPFKIIKLDKYIIWDAFKNEKAGITLEYTIGMLNALQLYIVAEGVETAEMRDKLTEIGCHYMQGWFYSKAVCDTEFMEIIEMQAKE